MHRFEFLEVAGLRGENLARSDRVPRPPSGNQTLSYLPQREGRLPFIHTSSKINHELTLNQATRPLDPFFMHFCTESVHGPHTPPVAFFGEKVAGTQLTAHLDMLWELELQVGFVLSIPHALALLMVSRACRSAF